MIKGQKVTLQPTSPEHKQIIFEWLRGWSELELYGQMPSWDEFCDDYLPFFFDGSHEELGRCFLIIANDDPIGQINYHKTTQRNNCFELDIWLSAEDRCGKGLGVDALRALSGYLMNKFDSPEIIIRPSSINKRAIRAYEKVDFEIVPCDFSDQVLKYGKPDSKNCILMVFTGIEMNNQFQSSSTSESHIKRDAFSARSAGF